MPTVQELQAEVNADPAALGYAALIAAHNRVGLAREMNLARATIDVKRTDITSSEVLEAIDIRDLNYPGTAQVAAANQPLANAWFDAIMQLTRMRLVKDDGTDTTILKNLKLLLSNAQGSTTRLTTISLRKGSRAEQVWGAGTVITEAQLVDAGYN